VLAGVVLLLAATTALAALFNVPGSASVAWPGQGCTAVLIVGLRGNGDDMDSFGGMGGDTKGVVDHLLPKLQSRLPTAALPFLYDTGPAVQVGGHIQTGAQALIGFLTARHQKCAGERWMLVGQSEGAAVVHRSLASLPDQVAAVVLLADPTWVAGARYNVAEITGYGVLAQLMLGANDVVPPSLQNRVRSYCLREDPVCDFSALALLNRARGADVHTSYRNHPDLLEAAAAFAASQVE
jgi:cutinase